jgi:hypothetical protein
MGSNTLRATAAACQSHQVEFQDFIEFFMDEDDDEQDSAVQPRGGNAVDRAGIILHGNGNGNSNSPKGPGPIDLSSLVGAHSPHHTSMMCVVVGCVRAVSCLPRAARLRDARASIRPSARPFVHPSPGPAAPLVAVSARARVLLLFCFGTRASGSATPRDAASAAACSASRASPSWPPTVGVRAGNRSCATRA